MSDYLLKNLEDGKVWVSNAAKLNDPFENFVIQGDFELFNDVYSDCRISYKEFLEAGNRTNSIKNILIYTKFKFRWLCAKILVSLISKIVIIFPFSEDRFGTPESRKVNGSEFSISCFSEVCDSVLMWSHYSSSHTGVCLEFNYEDIEQSIDSELCQVNYVNKPMRPIELKKMYKLTSTSELGHHPLNFKHKAWSYEKEWRFMVKSFDKDGYLYNFPRPRRIILGVQTSQEDKDTLLNLCNELSIPVFQSYMSKYGFKLKTKKYQAESLEGSDLRF
ncbi:hypothetical protein A9Q89_04550 [Gammaproteobacteria bacterium 53_120_T64]|nr:hypothetical protein A9Q89_04550 [Gammaproteobacteria bacterium 53_120_T64]